MAEIKQQAQATQAQYDSLVAQHDALVRALEIAVKAMRGVGPEEFGAERFDLTDSKELAPVFAALKLARGES